MFATLFGKMSRRPDSGSVRLEVELMEERSLPSTSPIAISVATLSSGEDWPPPPSHHALARTPQTSTLVQEAGWQPPPNMDVFAAKKEVSKTAFHLNVDWPPPPSAQAGAQVHDLGGRLDPNGAIWPPIGEEIPT
jgi:hypothetical protein